MDTVNRGPLHLVGGTGDAADGGQRERGRDSLFLTAQVTLPGELTQRSVRVRNLSEGGLMIECDRDLPVGAALTLGLRGIGDVTGRVAWCAEGRLGIALDRPIDPKRARKPVGAAVKTAPGSVRPLFG